MKTHNHFVTMESKFFILFYLVLISFSLKLVNGNAVNKNNSSKNGIQPSQVPERANMSTPQMVKSDGYGCEEHQVVTKDGYILTIFRLFLLGSTEFGPPIILQHGLMCSSDDWLINETPYYNCPYIFLRQGYDVWLGNCRGNDYSQDHIFLSPDDPLFWNFSFHEMGKYDVYSVINYVLSKSSYCQLDYVGHSMGCTMFFVAMSEHADFMNARVRRATMMSPAVYISEAKGPLMVAADVVPSTPMQLLLDLLCQGRIIPEQVQEHLALNGPYLCGSSDLPFFLCLNIIYLIAGYNPAALSKDTIAIISGHSPSTASSLTLTHFMQYAQIEKFQRYDYGLYNNWFIYGSPYPPSYDLSACQCPLFIIYGLNDWLVDHKNVEHLILKLPTATSFKVAHDCNHLDFLYAPFAREFIYEPTFLFHTEDGDVFPPYPCPWS